MKRILSALAIVTALVMLSGVFALPASAAINTDGFAKEVVRLVNIERAKPENGGLPPLSFGNKALNDAAMQRAKEITDVWSHQRPDDRSYDTVLAEYGIVPSSSGENIAKGGVSPAQVVAGWMDSDGHRENILGGVYHDGTPLNFNWIGVAVCEKNGILYWAQLFIGGNVTDDGDNDPKGGNVSSTPVAPGITGPTAMTLTEGYTATTTEAYTITGTSPITVTRTGDTRITWNNTTKKLNIPAGLTAGTYPVTIAVSNGTAPDAAITFTLTVTAAPSVAPGITGPKTMTLTEGYTATATEAFAITGTAPVTVTKTGGDARITWNNTTQKLDIAAGLTAGNYPVTLTASNGTDPDAEFTFTLGVMRAPGTAPFITTYSLPGGAVGVGYSQTLAATGDTPITWSLVTGAGTLPNGLTLSASGVISGTPTAAGTFSFTVKAENDAGTYTTNLSITVSAAPAPPTNYIPGTTYEATPINWFLYYVCFGWLWMRF